MDGQADNAPESGGLTDLASFLADTPETESTEQDEEQTTVDEANSDEEDAATAEAKDDEQDIDPEAPDAGEEEPAPVEKIKFKIKGEDGEELVEATPEEIASSWMRHKDYTKKTQALAERENEAVEFFTKKHEEIRNDYLSKAELTQAAIVQLAGIRSEAEMAQLAHTDPAAWVAESQRQRQIEGFLGHLGQQIAAEKQQAVAQSAQLVQQQRAKQFERAWQELSKQGLDKPQLSKIYSGITDKYGFTEQELSEVYDHRMVMVMKDAMAYRALKEQKPQVMKKVQDAPRMPSKQSAPENRRDQALENKFKSGRAKLNDLAAYLR